MIDEPFKNTFDKDRIGARDIPQTAKTFWEKSLSNMDTTPIRGFANTLAETGATSQISIDLTGEERVRIQTFESTINKASKAFVSKLLCIVLLQPGCANSALNIHLVGSGCLGLDFERPHQR